MFCSKVKKSFVSYQIKLNEHSATIMISVEWNNEKTSPNCSTVANFALSSADLYTHRLAILKILLFITPSIQTGNCASVIDHKARNTIK